LNDPHPLARAHLYLVRYQAPGSQDVHELVGWGRSPDPLSTQDPDLRAVLRTQVDAEAMARFGRKAAHVVSVDGLTLDGVTVERPTPEEEPRPLPCLPRETFDPSACGLRVWHVIRNAHPHVQWELRPPEGAEGAGVLCLAPTAAAAVVSAWNLWSFTADAHSPTPGTDLAHILGSWERGACGMWPVRDEQWSPVAVLAPPRADPEKIYKRAAVTASRGLLAFIHAPA